MTKLNAASKSVIANVYDAADSVTRASFDEHFLTCRREDEIIQFYVNGDYAFIRAEVEHPDDGALYYVFIEDEGEGINWAITSLLAKLTHDSLVNFNDQYPKYLLEWMLGMGK